MNYLTYLACKPVQLVTSVNDFQGELLRHVPMQNRRLCLKRSIFTFFFPWKDWYNFSHLDAFPLYMLHLFLVLTALKQSHSLQNKNKLQQQQQKKVISFYWRSESTYLRRIVNIVSE